ncbi:MAG: 50S ribosomal protein L28 [Chloroflexi bacterium]|nr:50S ribosomal protein L28 [Chloroflexota bacterium]
MVSYLFGIVAKKGIQVKGETLAQCFLCNKGPTFGHNVSHSKRRTNRVWLPNVHKAVIRWGGRPRRIYICTRCLRTQAKLPR